MWESKAVPQRASITCLEGVTVCRVYSGPTLFGALLVLEHPQTASIFSLVGPAGIEPTTEEL
jgi:hypothetical protein